MLLYIQVYKFIVLVIIDKLIKCVTFEKIQQPFSFF